MCIGRISFIINVHTIYYIVILRLAFILFSLFQLMPLLIQSLSLPESNLKTSTLTTLYSLVHDAPLVISQHVSSVIPSLLLLSQQAQQMVRLTCNFQNPVFVLRSST